MALYLTTVATVTINDLFDDNGNPYVFTHPTVDFVLTDIWLSDEIIASVGLQTELTNGNILINDAPLLAGTAYTSVVAAAQSSLPNAPTVLFEHTFTNASTFTITHNLGTEYLDVSVIVGAVPRGDIVVSILPDMADPTNKCVVTLDAVYSGVVHILEKPIVPSNQESSTLVSHTDYITQQENITQIIGADTVTSAPILFVDDTTRTKNLSVDLSMITFGRNSVNTNTWLKNMGSGSEGHVMPYDGTIVAATILSEDTKGQTRNFSVYVNNVETANVLTVAGNGIQTAVASDVNIDFLAGDLIKFRGRGPGSKVKNVTATVWVKWRY